jgi:hypothetical protein
MLASLMLQSVSFVASLNKPFVAFTVMVALSAGLERKSGHISRVALPEPSEAAVWVTLYNWLDAAEPICM